ncbi:MAG: carboxyl transferase domain-containing protein [Pilosibacter sp.]
MPGETAANAMYSRKLVKAKKAGERSSADHRQDERYDPACITRSPVRQYCAKVGMVDEIVDMTDIRPYIQAFTEAAYQNPKSICPMHQMVTPRAIREWNDAHKA